jgi:hypothetical protein
MNPERLLREWRVTYKFSPFLVKVVALAGSEVVAEFLGHEMLLPLDQLLDLCTPTHGYLPN